MGSNPTSSATLIKAAVPVGQFLPDLVGIVLLDVMDSRSDIHDLEIFQVLPTPGHNRSAQDHSRLGVKEQLRQLRFL